MNNRKRSITLWSLALSVLSISAVAIFAVVFLDAPSIEEGRLSVPVSASDHSQGNQAASIEVVVYSDFQCPSCAAFNADLIGLAEEYGDRVLFVSRHFPLPQHANSPAAAFAAEAAGKQGKYFEMRDRLFATADQWAGSKRPHEHFEKLAVELALDIERYRADVESDAVMQDVVDDFHSGATSNIQSTPAVFVNGRLLSSPFTQQQLRKRIDEAIKNR